MRRPIVLVVASLALLSTGLVPVAAQDATPDGDSLLAGLGYPELTVTTDGTAVNAPAEVEAGRYRLVLQNDSALHGELNLFQVPEGMTVDELEAAFAEGAEAEAPPPVFYDLVHNGGTFAEPDATGEVVLDLPPGDWVFNLRGSDDETGEEVDLFTVVTVTGELPTTEEPAVAAEVGLIDFDFEVPDGIAAGPQVWKVVNNGAQPHHLVLAQVPDGTTEEQVIELLNAFFGPPATPETGATPVEPALGPDTFVERFSTGVLATGQANWIEVDLAPGTYAAICFVPDRETGLPHALMGMIEVITVA
jgi:hypothetical protein